jgi:hypothetical protein
MIRGLNPGRGKWFFCSPKRPDRLGGPPSLLCNGYRGIFSGVKWPGREADHLTPCSAPLALMAWTGKTLPYRQIQCCVALRLIRKLCNSDSLTEARRHSRSTCRQLSWNTRESEIQAKRDRVLWSAVLFTAWEGLTTCAVARMEESCQLGAFSPWR